MFFDGIGSIVEPFRFTNMQRKQIVECFGGHVYTTKKAERAGDFIDQLEPIIELWVSFQDEPKITNSKLRTQLAKIENLSDRLIESIKEVDENMSSGFSSELQYFFFKNKILLTVDNTEIAINSLSSVANSLRGRLPRSNSKISEKRLAMMIADCYLNVIGTPHGTSELTNFSKVLKVIAGIFSINIGADIIKEVSTLAVSKNV